MLLTKYFVLERNKALKEGRTDLKKSLIAPRPWADSSTGICRTGTRTCKSGTSKSFALPEWVPVPSRPIFFTKEMLGYRHKPSRKKIVPCHFMAQVSISPRSEEH